MSQHSFRQDREEIRELLQQFDNLRNGKSNSFIEEEGFQRLVEYHEENEQYQLALEVAGYAISQYPYSAGLLILKADLLLSLRRYKEALFVLDEAEMLDAHDTDLYILKTDAYLALDMQAKAAAVLEKAIEFFNGEEKIDLLFELTDVYDDYEDFEKVFDCLGLILEQDPLNEEALYKICFWTDFTGRNEESIRLHQRIIEEHPFSELAWFNLGAAYQGLKLYEKSIDAYLYAVAIDEKFDYAYRNLGDAYMKMRKFKDAIEVLARVLELARPESIIYEAIGHCYDKLKNYAQARFHYRKASHLNPEDSQLFFKISGTYMNEARWGSAIKQLEAALKIHSSQPEYNLAMGRCLMENGEVEKAISFMGNAVMSRPKNARHWSELLICLYRGEMYEDGLEYTRLGYEQTDKKPVFIYFQSLFLFALGKSKEAIAALQQGIAANPRLVRQFIEINPSLLQQPQVVQLLAGIKKGKSK